MRDESKGVSQTEPTDANGLGLPDQAAPRGKKYPCWLRGCKQPLRACSLGRMRPCALARCLPVQVAREHLKNPARDLRPFPSQPAAAWWLRSPVSTSRSPEAPAEAAQPAQSLSRGKRPRFVLCFVLWLR